MKILVAIVLTDEQVKRIGWVLGNYADDLTSEDECHDWLDNYLKDALDELSDPPE